MLQPNSGSIQKPMLTSHPPSVYSRYTRPVRDSLVVHAGGQPYRPPTADSNSSIFAVSDCHFDYEENLKWCERLHSKRSEHFNDILILAGDACDSITRLEHTLGLLSETFARVYYLVGNHDLWVRTTEAEQGITDSINKMDRILSICRQLDIATAPERINNTWIAPLHSWHHASFDTEPIIPGLPAHTPPDYRLCRWPSLLKPAAKQGGIELAEWFDSLNEGPIWQQMLASRQQCDVISASHFLPRQELMPEKRFLFYPNLLPKASGSQPLERRVRDLQPDIHVFGHTHFAWDAVLDDGIRYIQAPLCNPDERVKRLQTICFDASMAEASLNPKQATWLPVKLYTFNAPINVAEAVSEWKQSVAYGKQDAGGAQQCIKDVLSCPNNKRKKLDDYTNLIALGQQVHLPVSTPSESSSSSDDSDVIQDEQLHENTSSSRPAVVLKHGQAVDGLRAHWSEHYAAFPRTPEVIELAPWVARYYEKRKARLSKR